MRIIRRDLDVASTWLSGHPLPLDPSLPGGLVEERYLHLSLFLSPRALENDLSTSILEALPSSFSACLRENTSWFSVRPSNLSENPHLKMGIGHSRQYTRSDSNNKPQIGRWHPPIPRLCCLLNRQVFGEGSRCRNSHQKTFPFRPTSAFAASTSRGPSQDEL